MMLIFQILLIVDLFLWFLTILPVPPLAQYHAASSWLAFIAVVILTVLEFGHGAVPVLR
jgi:hypothetical protein